MHTKQNIDCPFVNPAVRSQKRVWNAPKCLFDVPRSFTCSRIRTMSRTPATSLCATVHVQNWFFNSASDSHPRSHCAHHLRIPLRRDLFDSESAIRSRHMETTQSDPLKCCECEGVLLPDRAIPLKETWVLRYVCINCKGRSYAVKMGPSVRMYP